MLSTQLQLDIRVHAHDVIDDHAGGTRNVAPYIVSYNIYDESGYQIGEGSYAHYYKFWLIGPAPSDRGTGVVTQGVGWIYDTNVSTSSDYYYWATNNYSAINGGTDGFLDISQLQEGTKYIVGVFVYDTNVENNYDDKTAWFTIVPTGVGDVFTWYPPTVGTRKITLNWYSENYSQWTEFQIYRSIDGGDSYNYIGSVPYTGNGNYTFTDNNATYNHKYTYKVYTDEFSEPISATPNGGYSPPVPSAPSISLLERRNSYIKLSINSNGSYVSNYKIYYDNDGYPYSNYQTFSAGSDYVLTLTAGTTYYLAAKASNNSGESAYSNEIIDNGWYLEIIGDDPNADVSLGYANGGGVSLFLDNNGLAGEPEGWVQGPWLRKDLLDPIELQPNTVIKWTQFDKAHSLHFALLINDSNGNENWLIYSANADNHWGETGWVNMGDPTRRYNQWETFMPNIRSDYIEEYSVTPQYILAFRVGHFSYTSWDGDHGGTVKNIQVRTNTLDRLETWSGIVNVSGDVIIPSTLTLTLLPGTSVIFTANSDDYDGGMGEYSSNLCELVVKGKLVAQGDPENDPIYFKSSSNSNNPGEWYGIVFENTAEDESELYGCVIKNAKYGIYDYGTNLNIEKNSIIYNQYTGVVCNSYASPTIYDNYIQFNGSWGIWCYDHSSPYIRHNRISDNDSWGLVCSVCSSPQLSGENSSNPYGAN
ncbi:hypothetical protein DRQ15_06075, partial [candidate division KSB1 bacterium]